VESPVGWIPAPGAIDLDGADVSDADWQELFRIDPDAHLAEADDGTVADRLGPAGARTTSDHTKGRGNGQRI
jgi:GTP-dependent phosphoenolpyruvate carboxykinase